LIRPLRRAAWRHVLACALAVVVPLAPAQVRLPALGEGASEDFSVGTERRMGEQIMREIRRDPDYIDDPVLLEYLQSIWQPLVAASRQRGDIEPDIDQQFTWESFLVRDRSFNAFALPGGYVGVHLGTFVLAGSTDELASVLAHELSHLTQRHIARSVVAQSRSSMVGLAALILGILAAARSNNPDVANAAIAGGQAVAVQGQLNFSRDMEREADRTGFGVLGAAGFATAGMASMFERLDTAQRLNDSGSFPYLRTHPLNVERMSEARSRALFAGAKPVAPTLRHTLMQARARVLMDSDPAVLRRLEDQAGAMPGAPLRDRLSAAYAGALAASIQRHPAAADKLANDALALAQQASPREPLAERTLRLLQAQVRLQRGDPAGALAALEGLGPEAGGRAPMMLRAQAVFDQSRQGPAQPAALRQSTETLQTWVTEHPHDASAWTLLSTTAEAAGLQLRALRAGAEARAAIGDLTGAIDRLRAGQQAARGTAGQDFIEASVIDARLRELQSQRRQLALEARGGRPDRQPEPQPE
jgi:beta-barrel assembly-enhancing protease